MHQKKLIFINPYSANVEPIVRNRVGKQREKSFGIGT